MTLGLRLPSVPFVTVFALVATFEFFGDPLAGFGEDLSPRVARKPESPIHKSAVASHRVSSLALWLSICKIQRL